MQRFHKKCKDFIRNAKNLQEQNFLTSGVKAHLGGLGGKWAVASKIYSPLYMVGHNSFLDQSVSICIKVYQMW